MTDALSEKMHRLSPDQLAEVAQFIESLGSTSHSAMLNRVSTLAGEHAFATVWDNPEDDAYDIL